MKTLSLAGKTLLEYWREPLLLGLIFAFPVILLLFYALAFGDSGQGIARHLKILVENQDRGVLDGAVLANQGEALVAAIQAARFEGSPIFDITRITSREKGEIVLREGKAALMVVIPPEFSVRLAQVAAGGANLAPIPLTLSGYPGTDLYIFARSMLVGEVRAFLQAQTGREGEALSIDYAFIPGTGTMSDFEFGVPGLIVFGVMFLTISTAMTMVREEVNGTLKRLRLAATSARVIILGVSGAQLVVGTLMVLVTLGAACWLGFDVRGSLLLAILIGSLLSLSAIGLGLLTACLARNDSEAANLSSIIGVLMVIVSGAMYPMPSVPIATIAGRAVQIYDLLPPAHAAVALQRVLIFGDGIQSIGYEIGSLLLLTGLILASGIGLFHKLKLS